MNYRKAALLILIGSLVSMTAYGQGISRFAGLFNAYQYAYGLTPNQTPLVVGVGNTATGAQTITLQYGYIIVNNAIVSPLATTAPITVGTGSNAETVTPSAVSCATPQVYNSCTVTATFSNTHGIGDTVSSGTFGLIEAVNAARAYGGGLVAVDAAWVALGGGTTTITSNKGYTNVSVLDWRGTTAAKSYTAGSNGGSMAATAINLY